MTQHGSPVYYGLPANRTSFSLGEKLLSPIVWSGSQGNTDCCK